MLIAQLLLWCIMHVHVRPLMCHLLGASVTCVHVYVAQLTILVYVFIADDEWKHKVVDHHILNHHWQGNGWTSMYIYPQIMSISSRLSQTRPAVLCLHSRIPTASTMHWGRCSNFRNDVKLRLCAACPDVHEHGLLRWGGNMSCCIRRWRVAFVCTL